MPSKARYQTGGNAVVALIFAEYINRVFWHATQSNISPDAVPQWAIKLTALIAIYVVTALCAFSRNTGARAAIAFTTVKVRTSYTAHIFDWN